MANKYHRQGFKTGKVADILKNVYKLDKTGKKDKLIKQLNEANKKARKKLPKKLLTSEEPRGMDFYTDIMTSDFETRTGPLFDRKGFKN
tara:strand:+ start:337 stop:603 length:267 start_codon:yes stop_codon:yes gene_type:complete